MSDVYRKDGKPDRLVNTEAERTAAKFEGFKLVKDAPKVKTEDSAKTPDLTKTGDTKTEAPKPGPKTN